MAPLDRILFLLFSALTAIGVLCFLLCSRAALRAARERDRELKMVFWAVGAMIGFIIAGVSSAYILLPILLNM
jgi:hypothetical protein